MRSYRGVGPAGAPVSQSLPIRMSQASGLPYYRQIEDQLAELIRSGQLPEGTRLPSVRELAAQTLVSLITVRRAYADLDAEGLIVRRQGQGTFVAPQVATASAKRAEGLARELLGAAIARARQLGLADGEISAEVARALADDSEAAVREAG